MKLSACGASLRAARRRVYLSNGTWLFLTNGTLWALKTCQASLSVSVITAMREKNVMEAYAVDFLQISVKKSPPPGNQVGVSIRTR